MIYLQTQTANTRKTGGWGDFLGTGRISDNLKVYIPYNQAMQFVSKLNLRSKTEWFEYCKSGNKPIDIPAGVSKTYKDEWVSWPDFLGNKLYPNNHLEKIKH